jgi:multiple sugar transport system substrate-binding protein
MKNKKTRRKRMRKRIISGLLAGMMVFSLAGCSSTDKTDTQAQTDASASDASETKELSGEITFVAWGSDSELECDKKACEKFMELYPGTTVNFEAINDDYATTVETRFLGGESPDVIYGHPATLLKWIQEGMLMPITDVYEEHEDLWDEDTYFTNLYQSYYYDGEYYATPVGADTTVLFYNKTMLDAAGIDYPTSETTWDEFAEMCEKLTVRDDDGVPQVLGIDSITGNWESILYSMGGKLLDDVNNPTKVVFDSEEGLATLNWINSNYKSEGGFTASDTDSTYITGGFSSGEYAFMISGVYDIVWLSEIEDFEWDIAPLPESMQEEGDTPILYCGYSVSAETQNPDLAKEFAYFMTTYDAQVIMSESGLITSLRKDVAYSDEILNSEGAPEHNYLRVDTLPYGQNSQGQCLCWSEMTTVVDNTIYQMVHGELTPEEAVTQIQTQCQDLLDAELNK